MDALKKAEEEKKRAAKRLQEVEVDSREMTGENSISAEHEVAEDKNSDGPPELFTQTAQFSLEPLSLKENEEPKEEHKEEELPIDENREPISELEIATVDAVDTFSEDLTVENPVSAELETVQESFEETQKEIDLNDTTIIEGLSTETSSAPFDDTFHGVLFEEEEQDTEVYEETLPGVPADQLVKDLGGGEFQPTPVAAQTVFSAGKAGKKQGSFKWGIFIVLALLAVGSFSIFYYFTITPVSRQLPSPLIARGIESSGIESSAVVIPPVVSPEIETENAREIVKSVFEGSQEEATDVEQSVSIAEEASDSSEDTSQIDNQTDAVETTLETAGIVESQINEAVSVDETKSVTVVEEVDDSLIVDKPVEDKINTEISAESPIENIQVDASLITISKSKDLERDNVMVSQAYKAYKGGHYDAAKSLYEDVLKNDPDNRDAHLGLAAIAIANKNRKAAYSHYVHLLELNPLDTLSMNALIGLSNSADPVKDESAIKTLIQRGGDLPYLYFSLGNLYAKQKRWADAQQAFFDAYRLDTTNPDYVLNLAISLDQLGQYSTALDYYRTAIDLSQNSSTRFDVVPVNNRILILSKLMKSKL
jgi:tetratricopeptide (TPR) repeat protein